MEYQLPTPRPPMLRVPTALTSSSLPGLMCGIESLAGRWEGVGLGFCFACFCFAFSLACFSCSLGVSSGVDGLSAVGDRLAGWPRLVRAGGGVWRVERACAAGFVSGGDWSGLGSPRVDSAAGPRGVCGEWMESGRTGRRRSKSGGQAEVRCGTHRVSPLRAASLLTDAALQS